MPRELTPQALRAAVDEARRVAEQRPARALDLASILRWTDDEPGSVAAATTAAEHAEGVAARSGSWTKLALAGTAWRMAGEERRAADCEARAATAVEADPTADPGVAAALAYLAGDDARAARAPERPSFWTRTVGRVAQARAGGDLDELVAARDEIVGLIRAEDHTPATGGMPPLGLWEWLEETFVVEAARTGAPVPSHGEMLVAAGLAPSE